MKSEGDENPESEINKRKRLNIARNIYQQNIGFTEPNDGKTESIKNKKSEPSILTINRPIDSKKMSRVQTEPVYEEIIDDQCKKEINKKLFN